VTDEGATPVLRWVEDGEAREAFWLSHGDAPLPTRVAIADGRMTADEAYGLAGQGTALLWRGDFQEARQLLAAMGRRADRPVRRSRGSAPLIPAAATPVSPDAFHRYRQLRAQRARTLNALLIPLEPDYKILLRRAPDIRQACREAFGPSGGASIASLRALLGVIGAHEWRVKGVDVPEAGGRIHPHYGVFAPIRREYVDLVQGTPLPAACGDRSVAFDIGTGTGVLAAVLARRGLRRVVATDLDARALACAQENIRQFGLDGQVVIEQADLFPEGRAALVVCNPPWLPGRPSSPLEAAVYDPESRMLHGFLRGLCAHLEPGGEGWLILSDLAEHLGLRSRQQLLDEIASAGLAVVGRHEAAARHKKAADETDALHAARMAEITSLWRLAAR
jgi:hypothetical protein